MPPMPQVEAAKPAPLPPLTRPVTPQPAAQQAPAAPAVVAPVPAQAPAPAPEPQKVIKRPFGEFFRKKKAVPIARDYQPAQQRQAAPENTGDLFGAGVDDELEIPAFLLKARS